jgi:hypothetical protein
MHSQRGTSSAVRARGVTWDAALVAIAAIVALWHPSARWVETNYTNGFYSRLDPVLQSLTRPLPFALGDALLVAFALLLIGLWTVALIRGGRRGVWPRVFRLCARTLAMLAVIYLWFEAFWGLNYDRVPVNDKVIVRRTSVDTNHVDAYADHVLEMLDANVVAAHENPPDADAVRAALQPQFEAAIARLGDEHAFGLPSVKPTIFNGMLGSTGDSGFMDPWTHEVNLYSGQLFFELPATFAHEWAHAAGFADESEANYVSVLTCINSPLPLARYSGWLLVWFNMPNDTHAKHRVRPQVRADVEAIRARYERQVRPAIARAQQAAYDRYLRANRVNAGIDSYRLFVRWMIGATYDAAGLPLVNPPG